MTRVLAAIAGLICAASIGFLIGQMRVQSQWDESKAAQAEVEKVAIANRIEDNKKAAKAQQELAQRIRREYANEIMQVRSVSHAGGLRIPESVCSGFASAAKPESASGSNVAVAGSRLLPDEISKNLWRLMQEADMIVASCRAAQTFIADAGFAP